MIILGYTTIPLAPLDCETIVAHIESALAQLEERPQFYLEILPEDACSGSATGQFHFTVFPFCSLCGKRRRLLAQSLFDALERAGITPSAQKTAVVFKQLAPESIARNGALFLDVPAGAAHG